MYKRQVLDPFTINLFTTTAEDVTKINELCDQGMTLENAIYEVSGVEPIDPEPAYMEAAQ